MITGRAVSALLLHLCERVVMRRAVSCDFAGALPCIQFRNHFERVILFSRETY